MKEIISKGLQTQMLCINFCSDFRMRFRTMKKVTADGLYEKCEIILTVGGAYGKAEVQ